MRIKNGCCIYIKFGSKKIKLPVNPEELEIEYPTNHQTYDVLGKGEIIVPRKPSLQVVSWESFFPDPDGETFVNNGARQPEFYVKLFEKALKMKQKCRLIIARSGLYDTNIRCIVSDFKTTDKGGEPEDIYYSLELTEYRSYEPKTISVVVTPEESAADPEARAAMEQTRPVEAPVLRVGASVIANGKYWYDSYGGKPFGTANNLSTTVTRIVSGNPYPVCIGHYGWLQESQLQITG